MRTAVLISGHMRSFERCLPNQFDHVYRHFPDAEFFVSTVRDRDSETVKLLCERFPNNRVEVEVLDCQPELPIPVPPVANDWMAGRNRLYSFEPYAISVHPQAVLRQLWQLERCWDLFKSRAQIEEYGTIIRARPDNYFRSFAWPHSDLTTQRLDECGRPSGSMVFGIPSEFAFTPWWGRFGGINDRFALLGSKAAEYYFTTYTRLTDLLAKGYPLHPERLIYASLIEAGCAVDDTLKAEFSKMIWDYGTNHGTFRDPEITMIDLAHLALGRCPALNSQLSALN
jgi:hypothetical protein